MVPKMRNTHVLIRLIERAERVVGAIVIPTGKDQYTEAEVIAVGPGLVQAAGGKPETFDLFPGQVVYVKHKEPNGPTRADGSVPLGDRGIPYHDGERKLFIVGEGSIIAILADSVELREAELAKVAQQERNDANDPLPTVAIPALAVPNRRLMRPN